MIIRLSAAWEKGSARVSGSVACPSCRNPTLKAHAVQDFEILRWIATS